MTRKRFDKMLKCIFVFSSGESVMFSTKKKKTLIKENKEMDIMLVMTHICFYWFLHLYRNSLLQQAAYNKVIRSKQWVLCFEGAEGILKLGILDIFLNAVVWYIFCHLISWISTSICLCVFGNIVLTMYLYVLLLSACPCISTC